MLLERDANEPPGLTRSRYNRDSLTCTVSICLSLPLYMYVCVYPMLVLCLFFQLLFITVNSFFIGSSISFQMFLSFLSVSRSSPYLLALQCFPLSSHYIFQHFCPSLMYGCLWLTAACPSFQGQPGLEMLAEKLWSSVSPFFFSPRTHRSGFQRDLPGYFWRLGAFIVVYNLTSEKPLWQLHIKLLHFFVSFFNAFLNVCFCVVVG